MLLTHYLPNLFRCLKNYLTIITVISNQYVIKTGAIFTGFSNPVSK